MRPSCTSLLRKFKEMMQSFCPCVDFLVAEVGWHRKVCCCTGRSWMRAALPPVRGLALLQQRPWVSGGRRQRCGDVSMLPVIGERMTRDLAPWATSTMKSQAVALLDESTPYEEEEMSSFPSASSLSAPQGSVPPECCASRVSSFRKPAQSTALPSRISRSVMMRSARIRVPPSC